LCSCSCQDFELEQWKSVEKNAEKLEILRMNDAKSWFVQLYLQRLEGQKHKKWRK